MGVTAEDKVQRDMISLKGMTFDEYLLQITDLIKREPENMMKMQNESFAKALDDQYRKSIADRNTALLDVAFPNSEDQTKLVEGIPAKGEERLKAMDEMKMKPEQRKALDSYNNNMMLLGQSDTFGSFDTYDLNVMLYAWPLWTSMYTSSWVFAKIIDRTGSDLIRNGWKIQVQPERKYQLIRKDNRIYRKDITPEYDLSKVHKKQQKAISHLVNAARWMLLYGGSVVCLLDDSIEDIRDYEEPLKSLPRGTNLNYVVADRWQGVVSSTELVDDDDSPDFNTPKYYSVRTPNGTFYRFHHTRVARFVNGDMPTFLKTMLRGWGLPIGTRIYNEITRDERIKNMITSLLSKYNLEIVQTAGMKAYMHGELTPEMEAQLDYKLSMINRYRHFNSMMFLDKDDDYQRLDGNVGGLFQLFDSNTRAVAGAANMPTVLLYGDQSSGLSGSSFDDLRLWDDFLGSERGSKLQRPIEKVSNWLLMSEGIPESNFTVKFKSSIPKTMNEKIDETRAVIDMYSQLLNLNLYDEEMVREELKEHDDLLFGSQLQLKSKDQLEEVQEDQEDDDNLDSGFDDFAGGMSGGGGSSGGGGGSFDDFDGGGEFDDGDFDGGEDLGGDADLPDEPTSIAPPVEE